MADVVTVFIDLANTLGTLATKNICHRDLKPQNILIASGTTPMIVDLNSVSFPVQKALTEAASDTPGTQAYFSPELAAAVLEEMRTGEKRRYAYAPTDDLYALGCVFYEVLVGELPYCDVSQKQATILRQIVEDEPLRPAKLNPCVPWALSKIVLKMLKKDPAQRYQSGFDVAADLEAAYRRTKDKRWRQRFELRRYQTKRKLPMWALGEMTLVPVDSSPERTLRARTAAPPALVVAEAVTEPHQPVPERRRRWAGKPVVVAAAAFVTVAALVTSLVLGQHCPPESPDGKGPTVLCRVKMAVTAGAFTLLSCVGPTKNLRQKGEEYLASCSADRRETVKSLGIEPISFDFFEEGPTVKDPGYGYELKAGPIAHRASNLNWLGGGTLYGEIRIGPDGATVYFNKLKLDGEGRERPICAAAHPRQDSIGFRMIPKGNPNRVPDSKLHPDEGFIYVVGGLVVIEYAHDAQ